MPTEPPHHIEVKGHTRDHQPQGWENLVAMDLVLAGIKAAANPIQKSLRKPALSRERKGLAVLLCFCITIRHLSAASGVVCPVLQQHAILQRFNPLSSPLLLGFASEREKREPLGARGWANYLADPPSMRWHMHLEPLPSRRLRYPRSIGHARQQQRGCRMVSRLSQHEA